MTHCNSLTGKSEMDTYPTVRKGGEIRMLESYGSAQDKETQLFLRAGSSGRKRIKTASLV